MANIYEGMNVRQKLAKARLQFLNQKVKKSGKNMHLEFKYFELEDIVPPAIRIFARVGLTTDIDFTDENGAVMRVYNTDNSEEAPIEFRVPYREVKPIVSNAGSRIVSRETGATIESIEYYRPICSVYGDIVTEPSDCDYEFTERSEIFDKDRPLLKTTGCSRTGCMFCGYGCHLEKSPTRFEQMKETHPKQYAYIMKPVEEGGLGYKDVIDWINQHGNMDIKY